MAFGPDELLRGGFATWVIFMILMLGGYGSSIVVSAIASGTGVGMVVTGLLGVLFIGGFFVGFISSIVMVFGVLLARPVGLLLRRVRSIPVHLAAYTALGILVGLGYAAVVGQGRLPSVTHAWDLLMLYPGIAATIAVPLGWWWTARRALREDAGLVRRRPRRRVDADAEAEDAAAT
jgi:hypothetical protein